MLDELGLKPKKSFGQNFLNDQRIISAIARACVPDAEMGQANVLEIGAGTGALTAALLERSAHVVAMERDRDLVPLLNKTFADAVSANQLAIIEADAARFDLGDFFGKLAAPRVLCGNLPYQITGRLLELATHSANVIERAVFMVQREVADRLVAKPSTKDYGGLTVFVRAAFDVTRALAVSRASFYPPPNVDSAVVVLTPRADRIEETRAFRSLVKAAFEQRRKTLRNAWSSVGDKGAIETAAENAGVSLDARGETLDVLAFARVAKALELAT
jgi:16S rRNA (adenine1518-N6/adenine1519-N6)-dimethyltransferase